MNQTTPLPGYNAHSSTMNGISVLILTKNEEQDLPGCLQSIAWSDDIHIVDSESTDRTREIATAHGAHVTVRPFTGYASQRNAGLALPFKHDWILILDADERVPAALHDEMREAVRSAPQTTAAFRFRRRDIWWGRWLEHAQISPWFIRLVRKDRCRYEREINEVLVADGDIQDLASAFDHYPFSKGLEHWIDKHNRYSTLEARILVNQNWSDVSIVKAFFERDFNERRRHQKGLFYKMPMRPVIKLFYMLIVRRAFLDGIAGFRYTLLQAIYEYFISIKALETRDAPKRSSRTEI